MDDRPTYRVWPPVALGVPWLVGVTLSVTVGDPFRLSVSPAVGWLLVVAFAGWNGWALLLMGAYRTALLPGGATTTLLERGPFRLSRNPLYVGLLALDLGAALLADSAWALLLVPVGLAALWWGAVAPEEAYLRRKYGDDYAAYCGRVRRWL
jgi:protein-S-isoprenylcysteine O-methyltransferase Ste14